MEHIQRGFAKVNGTRLYYEVAGEGHPLVLNHGGLWTTTSASSEYGETAGV